MIKVGQMVAIMPGNVITEVTSIQIYGEPVSEAVAGDYVGFSLKNISPGYIRRGYVCGDAKSDAPRLCESFQAQMMIIDFPALIQKGYCPIIVCHTSLIACKFQTIHSRIDEVTGAVIENEPKFAQSGDCIIATLIPLKPMCLERFEENQALGRFIVRDLRCNVAVGIILAITKK